MFRTSSTVTGAKQRGTPSESACLAARMLKIVSRPDGRLAGRGPSLFFATKRARYFLCKSAARAGVVQKSLSEAILTAGIQAKIVETGADFLGRPKKDRVFLGPSTRERQIQIEGRS